MRTKTYLFSKQNDLIKTSDVKNVDASLMSIPFYFDFQSLVVFCANFSSEEN